ncbi:alpha-galactosidase [Guptibacillus sedimenti]|uniref:alpha-galactosidase n=1 Tax=Guptibacillus sedimenti TaxID=3025680 RepID=UPI002362F8B1|nr:alpha-galactosidase [Pseudalkalibacillus sedimenti]
MSILVNQQQFHLTNGKISYIFHVIKNGQLGHLYFGKALRERDYRHFQRTNNPTPASCHTYEDDAAFSLETIQQEYPVYGKGDFREPAFMVSGQKPIANFVYKSHEVVKGKPRLKDLPATYANAGEAETLLVVLEDSYQQVELELSYTIFENEAVIARNARLINNTDVEISIDRMMSLSVDLPHADMEMVHLSGTWARERHVKTRKLEQGIQSISSIRGASSHHHNPFLALKTPDATEHTGEVLGFQFVYSGNFLAQAEVDHYDVTRVQLGIHPLGFQWHLSPGETFQTPEAIMAYSEQGMNGMSQTFHRLYRHQLIREQWKNKERPVLINNWEATYFDFNEEKLLHFAKEAKELGVELFVLDDGWFGKRNNDRSSLGDWTVDLEKLPDGIASLAEKVKGTGLQFGLWFEPEMISPDSNLFREHPEWAVGIPGEHVTLGRNQRVLDYTRAEVVDYIFERMKAIIEATNLDYIKWDMNRNITEAYSAGLEHQGEFFHRYILGVYDLYERLTSEFPNVLFESCAGGGGRFDPALLYYAPQAWASDDTDAVERLKIQYGTSMAYPIYSMGSHVSAVPNHQTLRETPLSMRADVAYFGTFGYELDPSSLSDEEKEIVKTQIKRYQLLRHLVRDGEFIRLQSPFESNETAWMIVSTNQKEALVGWYKASSTPNPRTNQSVKLRGLASDYGYHVDGETYFGDELMQHGLPLPIEFNGANGEQAERGGDFQSKVFYLKAD